jgi:hypothetical protein
MTMVTDKSKSPRLYLAGGLLVASLLFAKDLLIQV